MQTEEEFEAQFEGLKKITVRNDLFEVITDLAAKEDTKIWMLTDFALREMFMNYENMDRVIDGARKTKRFILERRIAILQSKLNELDELEELDYL